jgi:Zn-dependent oligopeptidase
MTRIHFSTLTDVEIRTMTDQYIQAITALRDRLIEQDSSTLTWDSFIQPEIDLDDQYRHLQAIFTMNQFHPSEQIRCTCSEEEVRLSAFHTAESLRQDLYDLFVRYYMGNYQTEPLRPDQRRSIEAVMRNYRRNGVTLPESERERLKTLQNELRETETVFEQNINEYEWTDWFSEEELTGLPAAWIRERCESDGEERGEKTIRVTLQYPDYGPLMDFCQNRSVREQVWKEYMQRAADTNRGKVQRMTQLRQEIAACLGYLHHRDYALEETMAKNTGNVMQFLLDLKERIRPVVQKEHADLSLLAQVDQVSELQPWDIAYYSRIWKERMMGISMETAKQYFTMDSVTAGILKIYGTLFGYTFRDITQENAPTLWHEDVRLLEVRNVSDDSLQGEIYMDMHPREGKYGHAAMFPMMAGSVDHPPAVALICNFPKNEPLSLDDMETYLHEMGHAMHSISSRPLISEFAGTAVPIDAVECPSQLMEEWCYQAETLRHLATTPDIPDAVVRGIEKQNACMQGFYTARQLAFCFVDMAIHGPHWGIEEGNDLVRDIYADVVGLTLPENHRFLEGWGHLVGYDAGYYGYLYAKVFAKCMFAERFRGNLMNQDVGSAFRSLVLAPGDTRDFMDLMIDFLGHPPTPSAFIESIKGDSSTCNV